MNLKSAKSVIVILALLSSLLAIRCDNELKVNAPKKDIIVVYGVLDPAAPEQMIRVAKAYLTEEDALQYASENDLSIPDARVTLDFINSSNQKEQVVLTPVQIERAEGTFNKKITVYTTRTPIEPGRRYELKVQLAGEDTAKVSAYTYVPDNIVPIRPSEYPLINNPESGVIGNQPAYPLGNFDKESYSVSFLKSAKPANIRHAGRAFESRVYLTYREKGSNEDINVMYGPTSLIDKSDGACIGLDDPNAICMRLGRGFMDFMTNKIDQNKSYTYDGSYLSESCKLEYTAVDTFLYNYMRVNSPVFVDFTTIKPEYTNVKGGLGVFGSINKTAIRMRLNPCVQYLLKFNDMQQPLNCK